MRNLRLPTLFGLFATVALAAAQEATEGATQEVETHKETLVDHIALISREWWAGTLVATVVLGLVVGFLAYRKKVESGNASKATGRGCLTAVAVFLIAQVLVIAVLLATVFSAQESIKTTEDSKTAISGGTAPTDSTGTPSSATTGTTGGAKTTTSGEDF